ncbi:MAG: hypothetical protein A2066_07835 [Bacteroidetes bacterium GWB2_41_8]|nr:MAG: hypothetical protein A2066_07835 [Bacteroidetes bacterium GWB2_41_8]
MKKYFLIIAILINLSVFSQDLATFSVNSGNSVRRNCPVSLSLENLNYNTDKGNLVLFELVKGQRKPIPAQIETAHSAVLWFILSGETPQNTTRKFVLTIGSPSPETSAIKLTDNSKALTIQIDRQPVLSYVYQTVFPPEGVDPLYKRSGFIHPLWSPEGEVLTRIQAPDHYHHYGIWNPWTLTFVGKREVDFWNLMKGEGTVRFAGFVSQTEGPVFTGFKSLQQHIDFGAKGGDAIAMNELFDVRAWNIGNKQFLIDYTSTLNTPLDSGILLAAYRYGGGIGYRATEKWHKDNSTVQTSENKDRLQADGSNARWCIVEGESGTDKGRSGILFMSFPANREFPEPMRVWPIDANGGRGDMYFEFCPIRNNDWKLSKGSDYTLKYRLMVFDGKLTPEEAEQIWQDFANPPIVVIDHNTAKSKQ